MQTKTKIVSTVLTVLVSVLLVAGTALAVTSVGTNLSTGGDFTVNTDKLVVTGTNGNLNIGPNTFVVVGASGNTTIAGTLTVNGNTTLGNAGTDTISVLGDLAVKADDGATNKFTVDNNTGNTVVSGTLGVTGDTTLTGDLAVNGGDLTTTDAVSMRLRIANGTLLSVNDGTNTLFTLTDMGTNGKLTIGNRAIIGGAGTNNVFVTGGNDTTTGSRNVALGGAALAAVTTGSDLVAIGYEALNGTTTGNDKIAIGHDAGMTGPGDFTVLIGQDAGKTTTGNRSIYIGSGAGDSITTGSYNIAIGVNALGSGTATTAEENVILGYAAGQSITTGARNVYIGSNGIDTDTGSDNVAIGAYISTTGAGYGAYSGSVVIGANARLAGSNKLVIDNSNTASPLIAGDFATNALTINGTLAVTGDVTLQNSETISNAVNNTFAFATNVANADTLVLAPYAVAGATFSGTITSADLTGDKVWTFPDTTGTVALTSGNVATATALLANPADCAANQFATTIAASGDLTCAAITDADVPDTITASNYIAKSLGTAQGDIIYFTAASTPTVLAKGTASQVLRMNAGATAPEWATFIAALDNASAWTAAQKLDAGITVDTSQFTVDGTNGIVTIVPPATMTTGNLLSLSAAGALSATGAYNGISVDLTNVTGNGQAVNGIYVNNVTAGAGAEYGIYVAGTNWDQGLYVVDTVKFDGAVTITEGALTDSTIVSADIKDGTVASVDMTAGAKTHTVSIHVPDPGAANADIAAGYVLWTPSVAVTITKVYAGAEAAWVAAAPANDATVVVTNAAVGAVATLAVQSNLAVGSNTDMGAITNASVVAGTDVTIAVTTNGTADAPSQNIQIEYTTAN